jgi:hypothetical protein
MAAPLPRRAYRDRLRWCNAATAMGRKSGRFSSAGSHVRRAFYRVSLRPVEELWPDAGAVEAPQAGPNLIRGAASPCRSSRFSATVFPSPLGWR